MLIIFIKNYSGFCELQVKKIKSTPVVKKEFKDQIVVDRLEKNIVGFFSKKVRNLLFFFKNIGKFGTSIHDNLHELKQKHKNLSSFSAKDIDDQDDVYAKIKKKKKNCEAKKDKLADKTVSKIREPENKTKQKISDFFDRVDSLINNKKFAEAEKKVIEIIKLDHKNIDAFRLLGEIYFEQKKYDEAVQTLEHVIKLGGDADDYFDLAIFCKESNDLKKAIKNNQKAIDLDPENVSYLEFLFELSIAAQNKKSAFDAYYKLKKIDPSNSELDKLKLEIQAINK